MEGTYTTQTSHLDKIKAFEIGVLMLDVHNLPGDRAGGSSMRLGSFGSVELSVPPVVGRGFGLSKTA